MITVQKGVKVCTSTSDTQTITAVDLARSYVVIQSTTNTSTATTGADLWQVGAQLTNSTTITFYRDSSAQDASVSWYVVTCTEQEFLAVNRVANIIATGTTADISISEVDVSRSMVIYSCRGNFTSADSNLAYGTASLKNSTTVTLTRGATSTTRMYFYFSVVEWSLNSGVKIHSGLWSASGDMATTPGSTAHGKSGVTTSNTWMFAKCQHSLNGLDQTSMKIYFDSTNIYGVNMTTGSYPSVVHWQLVVFPEDICYQYTVNFLNTDATKNTTITSVDLSASVPFATATCAGTGTAFARHIVSAELTTATNLRLARSYAGQVLQCAMSVVDFSLWNASQNMMFLGNLA